MDELNNIRIELAAFTAKVTEWMETTYQYRKDLCAKNDKIREELKEYKAEIKEEMKFVHTALTELPCKERGERAKNQKIFDGLLWGALGITFGILIVHLGWK